MRLQAKTRGKRLCLLRIMAAGKTGLKRNIGPDGQRWDQVELLKDHAHRAAPHGRARRIIQRGHIGAIHRHHARIRRIKPPDQMQKRAFARPAFTRQGQHFSGLHPQADAAQDSARLPGIAFGHVMQV